MGDQRQLCNQKPTPAQVTAQENCLHETLAPQLAGTWAVWKVSSSEQLLLL